MKFNAYYSVHVSSDVLEKVIYTFPDAFKNRIPNLNIILRLIVIFMFLVENDVCDDTLT